MFAASVATVAALSITLNGCGDGDPCSEQTCSDLGSQIDFTPSNRTCNEDDYIEQICDKCTVGKCQVPGGFYYLVKDLPARRACQLAYATTNFPTNDPTGLCNQNSLTDIKDEVTKGFQLVVAKLGEHTGIVV